MEKIRIFHLPSSIIQKQLEEDVTRAICSVPTKGPVQEKPTVRSFTIRISHLRTKTDSIPEPWNTLEGYVDGIVPQDSLYMVIGCYFDDYTDVYGKTQKAKTIQFGGRSDVSMPTMFYYALLRTKKGNTGKSVTQCSADELKCVAYVLRHETAAKQKGKNYKLSAKDLMSISDLEKLTGFKYFVNVPNAPKSTFNASDWGF